MGVIELIWKAGASRQKRRLEKAIRNAEAPARLAYGTMVRFKFRPRPLIICKECEASSIDTGEPYHLQKANRKVGVVTQINDSQDLPDMMVCRFCKKEQPTPQFFREIGVRVEFKTVDFAEARGVMAHPDELTIISRQEWDAGQ